MKFYQKFDFSRYTNLTYITRKTKNYVCIVSAIIKSLIEPTHHQSFSLKILDFETPNSYHI